MGLFHLQRLLHPQSHLKEFEMASEQEQKSVNVPQHKRIAMGEKLDGTSYQSKGGSTSRTSKPAGGLSQAKKSK